jgi:hypothetical protein
MVIAWLFGSFWIAVMIAQVFPPRLKPVKPDNDDPYSPPSMLK